jgi:monoamine oxidase
MMIPTQAGPSPSSSPVSSPGSTRRCAPRRVAFHFAGEHASVYHRWIQGAIDSGLRAAMAVHASD